MRVVISACVLGFIALPSVAQFPPALSNVVTVNSRVNPDAKISFKQVSAPLLPTTTADKLQRPIYANGRMV